jgi:hypothetical protein
MKMKMENRLTFAVSAATNDPQLAVVDAVMLLCCYAVMYSLFVI